jgi:hypothetical protein
MIQVKNLTPEVFAEFLRLSRKRHASKLNSGLMETAKAHKSQGKLSPQQANFDRLQKHAKTFFGSKLPVKL